MANVHVHDSILTKTLNNERLYQQIVKENKALYTDLVALTNKKALYSAHAVL